MDPLNGWSEDERGVIVAPAVRNLPELSIQLAGWLRPRLAGANDLFVTNLEYPRGAGQSHETILFDAIWTENGQRRERGYVVRIKPTRFTVYQDDMFVEQYRLMRVLHESGLVKVADPLWFEEDPGVLGAPFFVMAKIRGRVAVSVPSYMETGWVVEASPRQRRRLWENGVRELGAIQRVPLSMVSFLDRPQAGDGFDQEWDRYRRYLAMIEAVRPLPAHAAVWRRLEETRPRNRPPGLEWGDARLGNMMVGDDFEILAVMDWEQPSLGGALQDLGLWLFSDGMKVTARGAPLPGLGARDETIALWAEVTGVSTADIDWYEAFAAFKTSCLLVHMMDMKNSRPTDGDYGALPIPRMASRLAAAL